MSGRGEEGLALVDLAMFEVTSHLGKRVQLTDMQWSHITLRHKELRDQIEKMKLTLMRPDNIYYSPSEETYHYCKRFSATPVSEKYLLLVVKHRDDEGFIITAFFAAR